MTTALTTIPAPTPRLTQSLSQQEIQQHRERIAFNVRVVLSAYFQPNEPEEVRAAQLSWWADELQDWHLEQVVWALRQWNRDYPRLRPTAGDIVKILKNARGRKHAEQLQKERMKQQPEVDDLDTPEREEMRRRMAEAAKDVLSGFKCNLPTE